MIALFEDPLFLLITGAISVVCILSFLLGREVERGRPTPASEWRDCDCGDFPSVTSLFHSGTHTPEA